MGKVINSCNNSDSDDGNDNHKKRKRKKDLDEIRQNALAVKRNLRSGSKVSQKSKSNFMKTLNKFSKQREELENTSQCRNLLLKTNADKKKEHELNLKGFFRAGVKGRRLKHPDASQEKLRDAILKGDALKLLQSGGFVQRKPDPHSKNLKSKLEANPKFQMEFNKIFNESAESSNGAGDLSLIASKTSPILGGIINFKKNKNAADKIVHHFPSQENQLLKKNYTTKEERCKRRLFEDKKTNEINQNNENFSHSQQKITDIIRFSPRKSTPENVIFFTEHIPQENVNKLNKKIIHQINPTDAHLISACIKTCKIVSETTFIDLLSTDIEDPLEIAREALKVTYRKAFKDYLNKQTIRSDKNSKSTVSSNSEIMLEPDSAIARQIKKNSEFNNMVFFESTSESNSDTSVAEDDIENIMKRKRIPSSKGNRSEPEILSPAVVISNSRSIKTNQTMDSIHPDRQEIIARYLQDVNTNNEINALNSSKNNFKELDNYNHQIQQKEKLHCSDKGVHLVQKSTKHVPAILKKNRSQVDFAAKDKVFPSIEKCPSETINNTSMIDYGIGSEHTPNCTHIESNRVIEAPKCKYVHMNAKYNQPSRINIPITQTKKVQINAAPAKHLFTSPQNKQRNFILTQNLELSPIEQQSNVPENLHYFQLYHLSQESYDNNHIPRMVSFGEIQEKTDRLTLRSSQNCPQQTRPNENCSSQSLCYSQENFNPCADFYIPKNESSDNNIPYDRMQHGMSSQMQSMFEEPSNANLNYVPQDIVRCNKGFQVKQPGDYFYNGSESVNCCQMSNYELCTTQNCTSVQQLHQQQNVCQPVKFIAVGGNKMPQRHPLYNTAGASHSYVHKASVPNQQQQYSQVMYCQRNIPNQTYNTRSSTRYAIPPPIISSDFECDNIHKVNGVIPSIPRELRRNSVNFVPSNMADQSFIIQPSTSHSTINNGQRFPETYIQQMQVPSPIYSQVEYHRTYRNNNSSHAVNDVHPQQRNSHMYSKRQ